MRTSSPRSLPPTEGACSTTSDPSRERPATTRSTSSSPTARKSVPSRSSRRITGRTPRRTRSAESTPHASAGGTSSTPRTWIGTAPSTASRPTCPRSYRERYGDGGPDRRDDARGTVHHLPMSKRGFNEDGLNHFDAESSLDKQFMHEILAMVLVIQSGTIG